MKDISVNTIRQITGKAPLNISFTAKDIIFFKILGSSHTATKKLIKNGYTAENVGYQFIKIKGINFINQS